MPSGFQQDQNQLSPDFYRVVVTLSGGTGSYNSAAPANGAVNPYDWGVFATKPASNNAAEALARGNIRWQAIIEELTKHSDAQILDLEVASADNANANSTPTAVAFTVKYDRDAFVLSALNGATDIGGNIVDTVSKAIKHLVVSGIQRGGTTGYSRLYRVFNAVDQREDHYKVTVQQPDVAANVYADVSVNLIDGTELISTV